MLLRNVWQARPGWRGDTRREGVRRGRVTITAKTSSRMLAVLVSVALAVAVPAAASGKTQAGTEVAGHVVSQVSGGLPAQVLPGPTPLWINHFSLLPGDASVTTTFNAVSSGVGTGLTGLVIRSSTTGNIGTVQTAVQVPPLYTIQGVRVCYELSNARSFITQIRLSQVQNPPATASVLLDDPTRRTAVGPVCVNSARTSVDPAVGAVLLNLRLNFGATSDRIVVRGLALLLAPKP